MNALNGSPQRDTALRFGPSLALSTALHLIAALTVWLAWPRSDETIDEVRLTLALAPAASRPPIPHAAPPSPRQPAAAPRHATAVAAPQPRQTAVVLSPVLPPPPAAVSPVAQPSRPIPLTPVETAQAPVVRPVPTPPPLPTVDPGDAFLAEHLKTIRDLLIKNRRYPKYAQKLGQEGDVELSFVLSRNGDVTEIKILKSSGFDLLDNDALALITKTADRFPRPPKNVRITVPLSYKIPSF